MKNAIRSFLIPIAIGACALGIAEAMAAPGDRATPLRQAIVQVLEQFGFAPGTTTLAVANGGTGATTAPTAATALGLGTGNSPQFTAVNIGDASNTTLARSGAGDLTIEGNALYRAGGTDVPITDGGTGQSTNTAGFDALDPLTTQGDTLYHNGTNSVRLAAGTSGFGLQSGGAGANLSWVSNPTQLYMNVTPTTLDAVEDAQSYTVPAGKLANTGDCLELEVTLVEAASIMTFGVTFGSTSLGTQVGAGGSTNILWTARIYRTGAATQYATLVRNSATQAFVSTATTPAETLSGALVLKFHCTAYTSGSASVNSFSVRYIPAP